LGDDFFSNKNSSSVRVESKRIKITITVEKIVFPSSNTPNEYSGFIVKLEKLEENENKKITAKEFSLFKRMSSKKADIGN